MAIDWKEYKNLLDKLQYKKNWDNTTASTHIVKEQFCKYIRENYPDFWICVGDNSIAENLKHNPEWLYDFTVIKPGWHGDQYYIKELYLALESEWGTKDQILEDFQKLLQCSAQRKIMIFQASAEQEAKEITEFLINAYNDFERNIINESYLLACWNNKDACFTYDYILQ